MLVTATSVLPVARTRRAAVDACPTAGRRYAGTSPRTAEHGAVAVQRTRDGIALPGRPVTPQALPTWPAFRPTSSPRGESSASSRPV